MKIDKWLDDQDTVEEKKKREEIYKNLSKEEKNDLKQKKIRNLVHKDKQPDNLSDKQKEFLDKVIEFKEWLENRTYIKGDRERIEAWVENLYYILNASLRYQSGLNSEKGKKNLLIEYKSIPVNFLDEKTRIALNKKFKGMKKTNSDNYYLRKLKSIVREKKRNIIKF
jgi:hypothetical protein